MRGKVLVKELHKKIFRLWRDGHISRNERDLAFKLLDSDFAVTCEETTLMWLLELVISFPFPFGQFGSGLGLGGSHE